MFYTTPGKQLTCIHAFLTH